MVSPGAHVQVHAVQGGPGRLRRVGVAEAHPVEAQSAAVRGGRAGHPTYVPGGPFGFGRHGFVHHLEEPVGGGRRLVAHRQQEPDRLHRPAQGERRGQERHQCAGRQVPVGHPQGAQHQRRAQGEFRQRGDQRPDRGQDPGLAQLDLQQLLRERTERAGLAAVPAETLDHADAEDGLLHDRGQVADLVLGAARGQEVAGLEVGEQRQQRQHRGEQHQAQTPVLREQHQVTHQDRRAVDQQEGQREGEEHPDHLQVRRRPGEQLTAAPAVVEGDGQPLQPPEQVRPHRRLDAGQWARDQPAAQPEQPGLHDAHGQQHRSAPPHPRGVAGGDGPVHDPLEDQRDDQAHAGREDGHRGGAGQARPDGPHVRPQAQQRADGGPFGGRFGGDGHPVSLRFGTDRPHSVFRPTSPGRCQRTRLRFGA